MAWNDDPRIRDLAEFAKKHGFEQVVAVGINREKDEMVSMTYGENKRLCDAAKGLGDAAYDAVFERLASGG